MLTALITFAAEEASEPSKTPFYVAGAVLAVWALIVSAIGIRAHETFPPSKGAKTGVMAISGVLILVTLASAVLTS